MGKNTKKKLFFLPEGQKKHQPKAELEKSPLSRLYLLVPLKKVKLSALLDLVRPWTPSKSKVVGSNV